MKSWKLVESFDVDDGSLDGLSPQLCFVLGTEWEKFFQRLATGASFSDLIHANNAERLVRLAERRGRFVEHSCHEPGWVRITVGGFTDLFFQYPKD